MLLPKFNVANLSIAQDGIALQLANQTPKMLSTQTIGRDVTAILSVLQQHADVLAGHSVRLILSNAFVRFVVLPWRENVFSRQDWQGLAHHAFRQDYGNSADTWCIRVSLGAYGEPVVASAIDQSLYAGLIAQAHNIGFKWHSIMPLAMRLLNESARTHSLLIAEPEHLLLCLRVQGQLQQFSVASPPSGQESVVAEQMLARAALALGLRQLPADMMISGKLSEQWRQAHHATPSNTSPTNAAPAHESPMHTSRGHINNVFARQRYQHHASWLAATAYA